MQTYAKLKMNGIKYICTLLMHNRVSSVKSYENYFKVKTKRHIVASELNDPICHSDECQIGSFSSEATIYTKTSPLG